MVGLPYREMSTHLATFCAISVNAFLRSHQVQGSVQTKKESTITKKYKEKKDISVIG